MAVLASVRFLWSVLITVDDMPFDSDDIQVIISYRDLVRLLDASRRVDSLDKKIDRLIQQQSALRLQFTELLEAFKELM